MNQYQRMSIGALAGLLVAGWVFRGGGPDEKENNKPNSEIQKHPVATNPSMGPIEVQECPCAPDSHDCMTNDKIELAECDHSH